MADQENVKNFILHMLKEDREELQEGSKTFAELTEEHIQEVASLVSAAAKRGATVSSAVDSLRFVEEGEKADFSKLTVLISSGIGVGMSNADLFRTLNSTLTLSLAFEGRLSEYVEAFQRLEPDFPSTIQRASLANSVLPSFEKFSYAVDLRVQKTSTGYIQVPVVVAFFATDRDDDLIFFQMSEIQLAELREQLEMLSKEVEELNSMKLVPSSEQSA